MLRLRLGIASLCTIGIRPPQMLVNVNVQVFYTLAFAMLLLIV